MKLSLFSIVPKNEVRIKHIAAVRKIVRNIVPKPFIEVEKNETYN